LTPGTTDALVTIDSTSGLVTAVAPFVAIRGAAAVSSKTANGLLYRAKFTAVYDAHGKNLAPNGASSIVLDPTHGSVVSTTP